MYTDTLIHDDLRRDGSACKGYTIRWYEFLIIKRLTFRSETNEQLYRIQPITRILFPIHHSLQPKCRLLQIRSDRQAISSSSKFLDICRDYNAGNISHEQLIDATRKLGFVNVLDAFHNVNNEKLTSPFSNYKNMGIQKGLSWQTICTIYYNLFKWRTFHSKWSPDGA